MKIEMSVDKTQLTKLNNDLDTLFIDIGRSLASAPKMEPMVNKVRSGMKENDMKFSNAEIYAHDKAVARRAGLIDFDSPLMVTGQLVNDFIFHAGKPRLAELPYSNEFILGMFTWADKERKRPTYTHIRNETAKKRGYGKIKDGVPKFTYIKTSQLIKQIMKSPRYPVMDSIVSLYSQDIVNHCERLINESFKKVK